MASSPRMRRSPPSVRARRHRALARFGASPFPTAEALEAGLTPADLRSRDVTPVLRGVYLAGSQRPVDHGLLCAAAVMRVGADAWVAGVDAARLHGLPAPTHDRPRISLPGPLRGRHLEDVRLMPRGWEDRGAQTWVASARRQLPLTHPTGLVPECVGDLDLVDAVVLADALLDRAPQGEDLRGSWLSMGGRCARIARLARVGAESPMETKLRLLLVMGGFPEPVLQHEVWAGGRRYRFDLAYPRLGIAIEYDGAHHFVSEAQKHADIRRSETLDAVGWRCMRVVSRGVLRDPLGTLRQAEHLFAERGEQPRRSAEWMRHFTQLDPLEGYLAG